MGHHVELIRQPDSWTTRAPSIYGLQYMLIPYSGSVVHAAVRRRRHAIIIAYALLLQHPGGRCGTAVLVGPTGIACGVRSLVFDLF